MNRLKHFVLPLVTILVLASLFLRTERAAVASPTSCGSWSVVSSPSPSTLSNNLLGVTAITANDIWAVGGYHNTSSNVDKTLIEHWNGTKWQVVSSPGPGAISNFLFGVTAISTHDVWAVGRYTDKNGIIKTLIEHWDGTKWSTVASPNPSTSANFLSGVTAVSSSDVWAVGYFVATSGAYRTMVVHWNGTKWSVIKSPNRGSVSNVLVSISAISANDIWAVGSLPNGLESGQTLVEHWNGTQWSIISSPNPGPQVNYLYGVTAVSTSDVWAAGFYINANHVMLSLVEHWNGQTWSVVQSANPGTDSNLFNSVTKVSAKNIWAVGYYLNTGGGPTKTLIEHWNGTTWSTVSSPSVGTGSNYLSSVARVPGTKTLWTVGYYYNTDNTSHTLTEYYC